MKCASPDCSEEASVGTRCRDCDIEHLLNEMTCGVCMRMRYRTDDPTASSFGWYLWGDPCKCPRPA